MIKFIGILIAATIITSQIQAAEINSNMFEDEAACMQYNVYHEGRGLGRNEQLLIGLTTLERVKSKDYPNTVCGVVWQHNNKGTAQFSWTKDGKSDRIHDRKAWDRLTPIVDILMIAKNNPDVILLPADMEENEIVGMMWYHAQYVNPRWAKNLTLVASKNGHKYYKR